MSCSSGASCRGGYILVRGVMTVNPTKLSY